MRINVYAEEITTEVETVTKAVNQELFYGIRLFLKSANELHYGTSDDDRSAITLWVPYTKKEGHNPALVLKALQNMLYTLEAEAMRRGDRIDYTKVEH